MLGRSGNHVGKVLPLDAKEPTVTKGTQDPTSRITSVKAAQKFFSEDKDRSFEAKVRLLECENSGIC